jgi:tetratricopeptide (TPR) repeat protein
MGFAAALCENGDHEMALATYRDQLAKNRANDPNATARRLSLLDALSRESSHTGDIPAAERACREALAIRQNRPGGDHVEVARNLEALATLLSLGRPGNPEAERLCRQAIDVQRKHLAADHPDLLDACSTLAAILMAQGQYDEAERQLRATLTLLRAAPAAHHARLSACLRQLSESVLRRGDPRSAEPLARESLAVLQQERVQRPMRVAATQQILGQILMQLGNHHEAEQLLERAFSVCRTAWGPWNPQTIREAERIAACYLVAKRPNRAVPYVALIAQYHSSHALHGLREWWARVNRRLNRAAGQ